MGLRRLRLPRRPCAASASGTFAPSPSVPATVAASPIAERSSERASESAPRPPAPAAITALAARPERASDRTPERASRPPAKPASCIAVCASKRTPCATAVAATAVAAAAVAAAAIAAIPAPATATTMERASRAPLAATAAALLRGVRQ